MGRSIPEWGLFRLLKGLEARGMTGALDLQSSEGPVTLGLRKGRVYQADSDDPSLGFGAFLVKARMLPDPATAERLASTRRLVDAGIIRQEDAAKLHGSYARSVLARILAGPISDWSFHAADALQGVLSDHPVDPFPELLRAVSREGDVSSLRAVVLRLRSAGPLVLEPGAEFALSHAKAHFGEIAVVKLLRAGRVEEIDDVLLAGDDAARIVFALVVAGLLRAGTPAARDPGAAAAEAPPPARAQGEELPSLDEVVPRPTPELGRRAPTAGKMRPVWMQASDPVQMASVSNPFEKELAGAWGAMQSRNHFEVLGVPVDARESAVRSAWLKTRHQFARAKYDGVVSIEAMQILDQIHAYLDAMLGVLTDRTRRVAYNKQIGCHTPSLDARMQEIFDARALWRQGSDLMKERKPAEALEYFETAARQDPGEPEYRVSQAWAILAMPPTGDNGRRARLLVDGALKDEPDLVSGLACQAAMLRLEGKLDEAREVIRRALAMDPDDADAHAVRDLLKPRAAAPKMRFVKERETLVDRLKKLFSRR